MARSPVVVRGHGRRPAPSTLTCSGSWPRAGSTTVQFDDAIHVGGLTHYRARFVKLIEQALDATAI
jgi:hypothetical protein